MVPSIIRHLLVYAVLLVCGALGYNPSAYPSTEVHRNPPKDKPLQLNSRTRRILTATWGPTPASAPRLPSPATTTSLPRLQ